MYTLGADSIRGVRPDKDIITISFTRFQLLRTIAHAAKAVTAQTKRVSGLLKELDQLEIAELVGKINV